MWVVDLCDNLKGSEMNPNPASMNGPDPEPTFKIILVYKRFMYGAVVLKRS